MLGHAASMLAGKGCGAHLIALEYWLRRSRTLSSTGFSYWPNEYRRPALISSLTRLRKWPSKGASGRGSSTVRVHSRSVPWPPASGGKSNRRRASARLVQMDDQTTKSGRLLATTVGSTSSSSKVSHGRRGSPTTSTRWTSATSRTIWLPSVRGSAGMRAGEFRRRCRRMAQSRS
jgi:hypothetical protein